MFKRFNQFILAKILGIRLRSVAAVFLGGCAGLSLTTTILPAAIEFMRVSDSFSARLDLAGFAVYAIMLWGVGGWAAKRTGSILGGAVVLGLVGLTSAALFTGMAYGAGTVSFLFCTFVGTVYGAIGGMLIAAALVEPATKGSVPD